MSKRKNKNPLAVPGQQVRKISGKPFKSGEKIGTVTGIVPHPVLPDTDAYSFAEDDSLVRADYCEVVEI